VVDSDPGDDDVIEQGGTPRWWPGWARRPRWLPAAGSRPSRAAAVLGVAGLTAGLVVGLAAGYQVGRGHPDASSQAPRPTPSPAGTAGVGAGASDLPLYSAPDSGQLAIAAGPGADGLTALVQSGGVCSIQHGRELQLGVEVMNLSDVPVTLGEVTPVLPLGGLRMVSRQWAPCGALVPTWQGGNGGMTVFVQPSSGTVQLTSPAPGGPLAVPPNGTAWLSVTFQVKVACPKPLPVQFTVSYLQAGQIHTAQLPGFPDLGQVAYTGCQANS
jgi:hypothetical protein